MVLAAVFSYSEDGNPAMLFVSDLINKKMIDFIKKGAPL
jgi:hypothetical protein